MAYSSYKPKVFITGNVFPKTALDLLAAKFDVEKPAFDILTRDELLVKVVGKDALLVFPPHKIDSEVLDVAGKNLKCVSTFSVGFDHIDVKECAKRKVIACHTPNVLTNTVAELGIALMMTAARRIVEANNAIKNNEWIDAVSSEWMFGTDISNSVVGICGFGRIGRAIAKRLKVFEPKNILFYDIYDIPEDNQLGAEKVDFNNILERSDFLIICSTLTPSSHKMFDAEAFSKMKPNSILVNISRGPLVDQKALVLALKTKQIQAAALDVMEEEPIKPDDPLLALDNCVLTPHIGTATQACRTKMAILAVENIFNCLTNQPIEGEIRL